MSGNSDIICRICGGRKALSDFYPRQVRACGTVGLCKECTKRRVRLRAATNPDVQAYDRRRAKLPHRREKSALVSSQWRRENPQAYKAQTALGNAIRDGKIARQPCEVCGDPRTHAHHADYAKPLDVRWLCALHHHRLHAADPGAEGQNKRKAG